MAIKKPIVVLDNGGAREIVEQQIGFIIVTQRFREACGKYGYDDPLSNAALRAEMGLYGRQRVDEAFPCRANVAGFRNFLAVHPLNSLLLWTYRVIERSRLFRITREMRELYGNGLRWSKSSRCCARRKSASSKGGRIVAICKGLGVSEQISYRWRQRYGGLKLDQARAA